MHIVTLPRAEVLTVKFNGKVYQVTMSGDGAHVPDPLAQHMIAQGLVAKGYLPNPKPRWQMNSDGSHGPLIEMYSPWLKEMEKPT